MNKWSTRRKRIIFLLILSLLIILVGVPLFFILYRAPTCSDGKQNGDEKGVDCGGSCQLLCSLESLPIIQKGDSRILSLATSTFEVVAIFDNPNASAEVYRAGYSIKIYEQANPIAIKTIEGTTFIPKNSTFAIFEGPFVLENAKPDRAVLEWKKESLIWQKNIKATPSIVIKDEKLTGEETAPRLELIAENSSLEEVKNIELVSLVLDEQSNIFAASRTFIDSIPPGKTAPAVFSWPEPFKKKVSGADIISRILPDKSFIR